MTIDMDQIQAAITLFVAFGTAFAPIIFGIVELVKEFIPSKYLKIFAVVLGGVLGVALVAAAPFIGITGLNYVVGAIGGLVGGFVATKQYDKGVKTGIEKVTQE